VPVSFLNQEQAAEHLRSGGVLVLGTDTLPGFHCRFDSDQGLERIVGLKGRSPDKPLLVLAADWQQARLVMGPISSQQEEFCHRCWPGPFSLILPACETLSPVLTAGTGTVAIRVPDFPELTDFLGDVGRPLVSTSVNREGEAPALNMETAIGGDWPVDGSFAVDRADGAGKSDQTVPSALVDMLTWPPRVLRPGPRELPE